MEIDIHKNKQVREVLAYVASETMEGAYYKVCADNNDWSCTCARFKHKAEVCKHIDGVRDEI